MLGVNPITELKQSKYDIRDFTSSDSNICIYEIDGDGGFEIDLFQILGSSPIKKSLVFFSSYIKGGVPSKMEVKIKAGYEADESSSSVSYLVHGFDGTNEFTKVLNGSNGTGTGTDVEDFTIDYVVGGVVPYGFALKLVVQVLQK